MLRLFVALLALTAVLTADGTQAQNISSQAVAEAGAAHQRLDYTRWESVASRAEAAIDEGIDSTETLETLRGRITEFRERFDTARQANAERIARLRNQIAALGDPPEEGETEDEEVAARRAELEAQLEEFLAPVQVADEAFSRADGLVAEIDAIIRERQTERLLELGPSPVNPAHWPQAAAELGAALSDVAAERRVIASERLFERSREHLPIAATLLIVGLVMIIRGRFWAAALARRFRRPGARGTGVYDFILSLLRVALPLAGVYLLTEAVALTGLVSLRVGAIVEALPAWAMVILGFRWLAERLFTGEADAILPMDPAARRSLRRNITLIACLLVLGAAVQLLFRFSEFSAASEAVVAFPVLLALGLVLYRIGTILRRHRPQNPEATEAEEEQTRRHGLASVVQVFGLAAQVVAVVSPVMAAIGYAAVSQALMFPTILSLALLGLVLVLQRFLADLYGLVTGQGAAARDSLMAVLFGFVLILAAAPFLALIWGARVADLTELWATFMRGFQLGDTRISPTDFLTFAIVFAAGFVLTRVLQSALRVSVLPKTRLDIGGQNALISGMGYVGIFLAAVIAVTSAGIDLSSLAIVAGALSVGIGFGLQTIVSNFVSGIILLIERPISEGDWIMVGEHSGFVRDISVRSTRIETFDRTDVIVPNSDLVSGTVTNYTRGNSVGRAIIPVGVAYGSDTRRVENILKEIAGEHPMVLMNPPPVVTFQGFGDSSLDFDIRVILRDITWIFVVKTEINHRIAERFAEEGIEIPFPQRDLWLRNPETLSPRAEDRNVAVAPAADTTNDEREGANRPRPKAGNANT